MRLKFVEESMWDALSDILCKKNCCTSFLLTDAKFFLNSWKHMWKVKGNPAVCNKEENLYIEASEQQRKYQKMITVYPDYFMIEAGLIQTVMLSLWYQYFMNVGLYQSRMISHTDEPPSDYMKRSCPPLLMFDPLSVKKVMDLIARMRNSAAGNDEICSSWWVVSSNCSQ